MKGIIFNIIEAIVRDAHGEEAWDAILARAGLDGVYSSLLTYDDSHLTKIVGAAAALLSADPAALVPWVGERAFEHLAERHPRLVERHRSARTLLCALDSFIHPEVLKMHEGAELPHFDVDEQPDGSLRLHYSSRRQMCTFAEGLIRGAGAWFHEGVDVVHDSCTARGDASCVLSVRFLAPTATLGSSAST